MKKLNSTRWPARLGLLALVLVTLAACTGGAADEAATAEAPIATEAATAPVSVQPDRGQAVVNSVDVLILESFPVQVNIVARGDLPDSCTTIDQVISQRDDAGFRVAITTFRQPDQVCTQALVPFEETVSLDVAGLPAGTYPVIVNGVQESFTLDIDNALPEETVEPTSEATGLVAGAASIGGLVWHDVCGITGSATVEGQQPPEGCVVAADGETIIANGTLDEGEEGIPGVEVHMFAGDCTSALPGEELIALTDDSGRFSFDDLEPGDYCVFIDVAEDQNVTVLEEGQLTYPTNNGVVTNSVTVTLEVGVSRDDINFGYDFAFRPIPDVDLANCTNSFEFVQDLTVPDDTVFPPGAEFTAAWRVRNNGTCPWTEEYTLASVGGDPMTEELRVPLPNVVAPGQTVDVSAVLTAPLDPGTYRGNWQIANAAGEPFGINGVIEDAFWVQIVVDEAAELAPTVAPGATTGIIGGVVWEDVCFITNSGTPSRGCVETEEGSGFFRGDGSLNFGEAPLAGITVLLGQGVCGEGGRIDPANLLSTTVTGEDGLYRFPNLAAGTYCVSIDALSPENVNLLIPGNWTWPAPGTGRTALRLAAGEEQLEIDFGWDFQE
jgi:inhibitor of cysteine peptidase